MTNNEMVSQCPFKAKAAKSYIVIGQNVDNHFVRSEKMVKIGFDMVKI